MRAEINEDGKMIISTETKGEIFTLKKWCEENLDGCNMRLKDKSVWFDFDFRKNKKSFFKKIFE